MADIPTTPTYTLSTVTNLVGGSSLTEAFAYANPAGYDPIYCCEKNSLLDFRGYCNAVWKAVDFCEYACYGSGYYLSKYACVVTNPAMQSGDNYAIHLYVDLEVDNNDYDYWNYGGQGGCAYVNVFCNWSYICGVAICYMQNYCSFDFSLSLYSTDVLCVEAGAVTCCGCWNTASVYMGDITPIVGSFCLGYNCNNFYAQVPTY